jgi:geranylgeranylglyceryl phosphate synthase family protein
MSVLDRLAGGYGGLAVLVDPARTGPHAAEELARRAAGEGAVALLVGNSFGGSVGMDACASALRRGAPELPLIQFPATAAELTPLVDAVLLLSLVSGRNSQYLIEEHVRAVPFFVRHRQVEAISTAYLLIDGGRITSVEAVTQTRPLPADKPELVAAHVHAARMIGMRAAYLESGSGADRPVADLLIRAARAATDGPLLVGGGVRTPDDVRRARAAGADVVVVGTALERAEAPPVKELALAARA